MNTNYEQEVYEYIKNNTNESNNLFIGTMPIKKKENEYKYIEELLYSLFKFLKNQGLEIDPLKIVVGEDTLYNKPGKCEVDSVNMFIHFDTLK